MNIAIIPARSGSQRIPGKNIKKFCGEPIIAYSINAAISSKYIENVIVSTDSDKIATIAIKYGALAPFKRPKELSGNLTTTGPVIAHAIDTLEKSGWEIDDVCCLYPCAPLLKHFYIDQAYEEMKDGNHAFAYPVVPYPHPPQRAMKMNENGKMEFIKPDNALTRTQDLEQLFHDAGQLYWGNSNAWTSKKNMYTEGIGIQIKSWETVDIDNEEDWEKAELLKSSMN